MTACPISPVGPVTATVNFLAARGLAGRGLAELTIASFYTIEPPGHSSLDSAVMSGAEIGLSLSVFLASGVECVEALTIVLAVGVSRGWASPLAGVGAALLALAVLVGVLGTGLGALPIGAVQLIVGALLLLFGFPVAAQGRPA